MSQLFASGDQSIGASALASVLPMNIQGWFPFELMALISLQSESLLQHLSVRALALSPLYGPALTFLHDYWKNHRFD